MKGLLIVCLCLLLMIAVPGLALERPPLHQAVITLCEKSYPEHTITAFDGFGNEEAGQWALILTKEGQHVLVIAEKGKDDPVYRLTVENPKAFMPGDSRPSVLIDSAGDALFFGCRNAYHIWDFMAVKSQGAWGQVSAQVWERNAVSPTSEYYMWVEDGMLHATHIISDGNDNTLSQTDYPPLPVPHLMGRMALHQFDYALMPATPQDLMGRHTPAGWPEAVAGALLHRGDRYIDGTVTPFGIFMLAQRAGERRLFIANWDKEAGRHRLTTSTPLLENAEIDTTHAGDIITVIIDRGAEPGDMYSFRRLADGRWGLCYVAAYELFKTGPNFVWQQDRAGDFIHWGTTPFDDIERIDFRSLPRTVREALAVTDSAGWAAVDNPMPLDRLHLREAPGQEARSLGEYYNGTPARVLERLGEWTQVDIAGVRGFMMTKYLVFGSDAGYVHRAFPEVYLHEMENVSQMPVYTRPDEDAPLAFRYDKKPGDAFHVLGEANEEWFHVYFYELGIGCYMKKECFWEGQG